MAVKRIDFQFKDLNFIWVSVIIEETQLLANDTCDLTVQVKVDTSATLAVPLIVTASRAAAPSGGTVSVYGGIVDVGLVHSGETAEAHWLVSAGDKPQAYTINVEVKAFGLIEYPFEQTFEIPITEER